MEIDHIHFYVEDAKKQRDWFIQKMGFQLISQDVNTHTITEVVGINSIFLVISSPLTFSSPITKYLKSHPPGVVDIAFRVEHIDSFMSRANYLGVKVTQPIQIYQSDEGTLKWAKIRGWNTLEHTLIENKTSTPFCCIFKTLKSAKNLEIIKSEILSHTTHIDHVVLNVAVGELKSSVAWYQKIFNFKLDQTFNIQTKYSGLFSKALVDSSGKIYFNINEPTSPNSQVQEFLKTNRGSGIQHIALGTTNILETVSQLRQLGLSFLSVSQGYYQQLKQRYYQNIHSLKAQEWQAIETEEILIDWKIEAPQALLMQIFTKPIFNEPTFFFELIERRQNAQGFGEGNFQVLFEVMEREQITRNNPLNCK